MIGTFVIEESPSDVLFAFGPDADLTVLAIKIDTWKKYWGLLVAVSMIQSINILVNDIGSPNLGFSVYDPTTRKVFGFTRRQLAVYANSMWFINDLNTIFTTKVIVSRFDVAILSAVAGAVSSCLTINYLLGQKEQFIPDNDCREDMDDTESPTDLESPEERTPLRSTLGSYS